MQLSLADRWIIGRLQQARRPSEAIDHYRPRSGVTGCLRIFLERVLRLVSGTIEAGIWDDDAAPALKKGTRRTLVKVLEATLRLAQCACS